MRTQTIIIFGLVLLGIGFTACEKEDDINEKLGETSVALVYETITSEAIENEIIESVDQAITYAEGMDSEEKSATISDCTDISIQPFFGFPKTITIDFGDGCEGTNGFMRSGSMSVTVSDTLKTTGSTYDVTFDNFAIEGTTVSGSISVENTSSGSVLSFSQEMNLILTSADGIGIEKTKTVDRAWIEGAESSDVTDDVFSISGAATVSSTAGWTYSYVITDPLIISYSCDVISEGMLVITTATSDEPITIDFGNGSCDWKVYVSQGNIVDEEINLND